jgi:cyclohexadienyl dehydratase
MQVGPIRFLLLATAWLATLPGVAGVLDNVRSAGVVRIGTTGDYQPFSYRKSDRLTGIDIDLGERLAAHLNVEVDWVMTSWPTLMDDLRANRFDVAMSGISITASRSETAFFSRPYIRTGKTVLTRCSTQQRFTTLAAIDQPTVRVIVNPGGTNEKFVRRALSRAQIVVHPDNVTIFAALAVGAADLMITDGIEAVLVARDEETLCAPIPTTFFETVDKGALLPRDESWRNQISAWLSAMEADGSLATLIDQHL